MAVFINYRREDSEGETRAIYNRLAKETDASNLFLDFEAIAAGEKWRSRIDETLSKVRAVVVIIGPRWLDILKARAGAGASDTVCSEIVAGLAKPGVHVIPVTVNGGRFPDADALPEAIRSLAEFNAIEIRGPTWSSDMDRLIKVLRRTGALPTSRRSWMVRAAAALGVIAAVALVGAGLSLRAQVPPVAKDMSYRYAQELIEKAGLKFAGRKIGRHEGNRGIDVVLAQRPEPGSHLFLGKTVEVDLVVKEPYVLVCRGGGAFDGKPGADGYKFEKYDGRPAPEMKAGSCQWLAGSIVSNQDPFLKPLGFEAGLANRFARAPGGLLAFCAFSQYDLGEQATKSERLVAVDLDDFLRHDDNRQLIPRITDYVCSDRMP